MELKNLKNELLNLYSHKIELHAHTSPVSPCSEISPCEMIETYKKLGYSAITVTNHFMYQENEKKEDYVNFFLEDFEKTRKIGQENGVAVYLGAEIRFTENCNDYLVYGVDKNLLLEIYDFLPEGIENFRKKYMLPQSVFIQAHPMRNGMEQVSPSLLDGIEVYNTHPHHNSRIGLASLYAENQNNMIITAGSDFHHRNLHHEGLAAIRSTFIPKDSFALAKLLKSGDFLIQIGKDNIVLR